MRLKKLSLIKISLLTTLSICFIYIVYLYKSIKPTLAHLNILNQNSIVINLRSTLETSCVFNMNDLEATKHKFESSKRKQINKILLISTVSTSNNTKELINLFESMRYSYDTIYISKLVSKRAYVAKLNNKYYYSLVVIDSGELFLNLKYKKFKDYVLDYAKLFKISLIIFFNNYDLNEFECINAPNLHESLSFKLETRSSLQTCKLNRIGRGNEIFKITKLNTNENVLNSNDIKPNNYVSFTNYKEEYDSLLECDGKSLILKGNSANSIKKILIGIDLNEILIYPSLLLDFISYATNNRLNTSSFERYIQIDIDDIFVGATGKRMIPADVQDLIDFQENYLNKFYFNSSLNKFRFNLGFSGHYYQSGNTQENQADKLLIENKEIFNWFDHTWSHYQPHILNYSTLKEQMYYNFNFALNHNLKTDSFYSVSPHHSGIYPIYESLYKLWKEVWLIKATSTEGYPHLRPYFLRKGFIHDGIMVVPRSTCGIFTHTTHFSTYPNGIDKLNSMMKGGEIFKTVLYNRVLVYMTHMTNYGNDRLALYVFKNLFEFLNKWTNLKFLALPPVKIAEKYFELHESDREPLWTNMCADKRHLNIWSLNETNCVRFPKLIILGPHKTGTTALYAYLNMHPEFKSNSMTENGFEETQFFTNNYYNKGVDWYLNLFEKPANNSIILFEKSANYFSEPKAPLRIKALLKDVKLAFISINPIDRAYSWYQHMKFHNNSIANTYSFYDVIRMNESNQTVLNELIKLRNRCLEPSNYYKHLKNWLSKFTRKQLISIDGDELRNEPSKVMFKLQKFMNVNHVLDYDLVLKYDERKKFFCISNRSVVGVNKKKQLKCLGSSKGRPYPKLNDTRIIEYLNNYFNKSNFLFFNLLKSHSFEIPKWLNRFIYKHI